MKILCENDIARERFYINKSEKFQGNTAGTKKYKCLSQPPQSTRRVNIPYLRCFWFQRVLDFGIFVHIICSEVSCRGDPKSKHRVPLCLLRALHTQLGGKHTTFSTTLYRKHSHSMELSICGITASVRFWNILDLEIGDV